MRNLDWKEFESLSCRQNGSRLIPTFAQAVDRQFVN